MLNIKNPETHRLAHELAELEGTSMTEAVTRALRAALDEHSHRRAARRELLDRLIATARAEGVEPAGDAFDSLYDPATGLPR